MPLPRGLPIVDHHCHLSPTGEGVGAAIRFRAAGGTHLFLATQNYQPVVPRSLPDYAEQFRVTEQLGHRIREETGIVVYPVIAPYPIDLVSAAETIGLEEASALQRSALDLAGAWIRAHRAVALGEVGRAHFPVAERIGRAIDEVFAYALGIAREVECPVIVHSADLDPRGFRTLAEQAQRAGVRPERMVKHYARTRVTPSDRHGVAASYLAKRDLVRDVLHDRGPWFLETDFLDDPARPGAVLDLATVPKRASTIAGHSPEAAEALWTPFVDSVKQVYGWRPSVDEATAR